MSSRANRPPMGIATQTSFENKIAYVEFLSQFDNEVTTQVDASAHLLFDPKAQINASHPINRATEGTGYFDDIIHPISKAFEGVRR